MKKIFSIFLAVMMLASYATLSVSAEVYSQGDVDKNGTVADANDVIALSNVVIDELFGEGTLKSDYDETFVDVNEDANIDLRDLVRLKKLSVDFYADQSGQTITQGENTFSFAS